MSPRSTSRSRREERGQILLASGVVVAFAIVGLVLILNSALFAGNLATREVAPGLDRGVEHGATAERASERALGVAEDVEYGSWSAARENVTGDVNDTSALLNDDARIDHGATATVTVESTRRGAVLAQTREANLTAGGSNDGSGDWTLATTSGVRNYTMRVNASETATDLTDLTGGGFRVTVTGSGGSGTTWEAVVDSTDDDGDGDDEVRVRVSYDGAFSTTDVTLGTDATCTSSTTVATVDLTNGTLGGDPCPLRFAEELSGPFELRYKDGSAANGTFHVVVSDTGSDTVESDNFYGPGSADGPRAYPTVYALSVHATYHGGRTDYETHARAAPGEPEATRP